MNKQILKLAIPNILSNLSVPLLSSVDTALMGRQEDETYIGAVALGSLIFNFIYWSFAFLRMGTTGLTAQALGKKDDTAIINILIRALLIALLSGVVIWLLQIPLEQFSFYLLGASDEVETIAQSYFYARIWAAPATLSIYVLMGWYFGMQNAIYPLILTLVINVTNILCNIYFVQVLGMQAEGVAWGTVVAQYAGLVTGIGLFLYKYRYLLKAFRAKLAFQWAAFRQFMALNGDIFIRTFCLVFAFAFFDNQSAIMGDMTLAVNGVLLQFTFWMSYGVDGFAYAAESLVGKYKGANDTSLMNKAIRVSFFWGMGLAVLYSALYALFGESLLHIFTTQRELIQAAVPFLWWVIAFPIIGTAAYIWDGIYVGITASKAMRNTMVLSLLVFLLFYYGQAHFFDWGNHGLWLSLSLMMGTRGLVQWWYFKRFLVAK